MIRSLDHAQPALEFIPPQLDLNVVRFLHWVLPVAVRSRTSLRNIHTENAETLVELYEKFQAGKVRFLIAFRHPSVDDPFCLAHLMSRHLPQVAKRQRVALRGPLHAHFIYDRGIPLWAGSYVGWLASRLGATPIQRGKLDRTGLKSARHLFANGPLPMAASPEGATNGHSEIISPLEPGISQMGFWCVEDLLKAGRTEEVLIVPVGIRYRYQTAPWERIEQLLGEMEADVGLTWSPTPGESPEASRYKRLLTIGEHLLTQMEQFYTRFYHQSLPEPVAGGSVNDAISSRMQALLNVALNVAEQFFNLSPKGTVIDRCRRLEQAAWDCIFREDIKQPERLSPLDRGLADRVAEEASLRLWHMRLVESFVAVTGKYILERPSVERFAETTLITWSTVARITGKPDQRPKLGNQNAQITIGTPISVSARWDSYQPNRRSAKQAVDVLTQDLQAALQGMIDE
jgi:1-acyl-sn-glycerol-3-phosphate acyltransferase